MLESISYFQILGKPLIFYLGITAYASFVATALVPVLLKRRVIKINMKWHIRLAYLSLFIATLHGILGIAAYL